MLSLSFQRTALAIMGIILALLLGNLIALNSVVLPVLLVFTFAYWALSQWLKVPLETGIVVFLIFGYIVGCRGFAQFTPPGLPIFFGELGIAATGTLMLLRIPLEKDFPFKLNAIDILLIIWILTSCVHLIFDLPTWRFYALRDFAMVYYSLFFFVGQFIGRYTRANNLVMRSLFFSFLFMPVLFILSKQFDASFQQMVTIGNVPLIFYKGDLVGVYGATGHLFFFFLFLKKRNPLYLVLSVLGLSLIIFTLSRAAMLALVIVVGFLIAAKIKHYFRFIIATGALGTASMLTVALISEENFYNTKIYGLYEHAVSFVDVKGKMHYRNPASRNTGDNNRYRFVWWEVLLKDTIEKAPIHGMGFGYDLANPFIEEYYIQRDENFHVRSPHNFLLTVFGRTGIVGLITILLLVSFWAMRTLKLINTTRATGQISNAFMLQCMCWLIFIGACFGVILEGPMGAIPFWLLLGMSYSEDDDAESKEDDLTEPLSPKHA